MVNQVSKTPRLANFVRGSVVGGSNSELRGTAELNYAFAQSAAFRINAMGLKSEVADRDFVSNRRGGVAPTLAIGIGKPTSLTFEYLHQEQNDVPDYGIPFAYGRPLPVPRDSYYGLPADNRIRSRIDVGTAIFKFYLNESCWLADTARAGNYFFDSRETAAHYGAPRRPHPVPYWKRF